MLIHLESGACESGIGKVDLQDMIHSSQLSRRFVDDDEFICPECLRGFYTFSGVCQHVEASASCFYLLSHPHNLAKMLNKLEKMANMY